MSPRASETRHASHKPADAERGGGAGIPAGAEFTIIDAEYTTWGEFGERALKRGRKADDPVLKLVCQVEGKDEDVVEGLGCGKSERLEPSSDGDFLDIPKGSTATALSDSSNAHIFLDSLFWDGKNKDARAFKLHKKQALPDSMLDDGIRAALIGLKAIAGREKVERNFQDDGEDGQQRKGGQTALVAAEIIEAPDGSGKAPKGGSKRKSSRKDEDEEERPTRGRGRDKDEDEGKDERPARGKRGADADEDDRPARGKKNKADDAEADAEKTVLEVMESPKFRDGVPLDRVFNSAYNIVKPTGSSPYDGDVKELMSFIEDEDWLTAKDRPWSYDKKEKTLTAEN